METTVELQHRGFFVNSADCIFAKSKNGKKTKHVHSVSVPRVLVCACVRRHSRLWFFFLFVLRGVFNLDVDLSLPYVRRRVVPRRRRRSDTSKKPPRPLHTPAGKPRSLAYHHSKTKKNIKTTLRRRTLRSPFLLAVDRRRPNQRRRFDPIPLRKSSSIKSSPSSEA